VALDGSREIGTAAFVRAPPPEPGAEAPPDDTLSLREQVEAIERSVISRALAAVSGNQSEAARRLGVSRGTLIDRMHKYGLN